MKLTPVKLITEKEPKKSQSSGSRIWLLTVFLVVNVLFIVADITSDLLTSMDQLLVNIQFQDSFKIIYFFGIRGHSINT
jgi:hypothetical protein